MDVSSGDESPLDKLNVIDEPEHRGIKDTVIVDETGVDTLSDHALTLEDGTPKIKPRAYQIEMLKESLKKNIIVAMDTGSGKTHIAVLRIVHELERMNSDKLIWFLAPTVALCSQQFEYVQSQVTSVQVKLLSGADNVDRWTEQSLWDSVLRNIKIVVSTYQVLYDALTHAFVRMDSLALIVFDEAHNCVRKHPGAKIMNNFYGPHKQNGLSVPDILGLTASPIMRSNPAALKEIEVTLHSICRTPAKHREELRLQVKCPLLEEITYTSLPSADDLTNYTTTLTSLGQAIAGLKIQEDPFVLELKKQNTDKSRAKLEKVYLNHNHKTWCQDQVKSIHLTALKICAELGGYAADHYISEVIVKFLKSTNANDTLLETWDLSRAENKYVAAVLQKVEISRTFSDIPAAIPLVSDKFTVMKEALLNQSSGFAGIAFVKERAMVGALAHLLSVHPDTRGKFRVGTMVGSSTSSNRPRNIGELVDVKSQKDTLSLFKAGIINLIVATTVLEEGIDVPACNLVLCFEAPENLKSFVQRRGRARHADSKLILIVDSESNKLSEWQQLELEMKAVYEDEMRTLEEALKVEDSERHDERFFRVTSTGATLDIDNAIQHLYHFCSTLPSKEYVDLRPEFICSDAAEPGLFRARVTLPLSVHEDVRSTESLKCWKSERNAIKDAAFQAYVALYKAGLVNDNLLPFLRHDPIADELTQTSIETRASLVVVRDQNDPWKLVADCWKSAQQTWAYTVTVDGLCIVLHLPLKINSHSYTLYWDADLAIFVDVAYSNDVTKTSQLDAKRTLSILQATYGHRFQIKEKTPVALFSTVDNPKKGHERIVRDLLDKNVPYVVKSSLPGKPNRELVQKPYEGYDETPTSVPHFSLERITRRSDFLHQIPPGNYKTSDKPYAAVLPTSRCVVDEMPFEHVRFGLFIPSIMRRLEVYILANTLNLKLEGLNVDIDLVCTAICASSAGEETNYQQLEFIGDSILKLCTSVQITAQFPLWHEGYLSAKKDRLVSNSRLCRAAIEFGLDQFIITKAFTGNKWRPIYVEDLLEKTEEPSKRQMSSKILADVVEALIGASMMNGGIPKALKCLALFLPEQEWAPLETRRSFLYQRAPKMELPAVLQPLEQLIGYKFTKNSLLIEAMSHASCVTGTGSLERSEFLGDSILDYLVVRKFMALELTHVEMHRLRTGLVNADFLAFLCMEWSIEQEKIDIVEKKPSSTFTESRSSVLLPLWRFMRHHSPALGVVQIATMKRHSELRDEINAALENGTTYPWAPLARLQAMKFYSDIVESLIGAVWIDSGDFEACEAVLERMGLWRYARRVLRGGVEVTHPKELLGMLAVEKKVRYVVGVEVPSQTVSMGDSENERRFTCRVEVGGVEVVSVGGGVDKEEVQTKAAEAAVRVLRESDEMMLD